MKINEKETGTAAQSKIGTDFQRRNRIPETITRWLRNPWQKIKQFLKKNCCNLTQYLWQSKVTQAYTPGWKLRHTNKSRNLLIFPWSACQKPIFLEKEPKTRHLLMYEWWETFIIIFFKYLNNQSSRSNTVSNKYQMAKGLYTKGGWGKREGCFHLSGRKKKRIHICYVLIK